MRTYARVDLGRIVANYRAIRAARPPDFEILAVVKANAYGHGARAVARALEAAGCRRFAVSCLEEGADLREAGVAGEIAVLGGVLESDAGEMARLGLTPVLHSDESYAAWREAARRMGGPLPCHLKLETGMNRLGLDLARAEAMLADIAAEGLLEVRGAGTHLASAEDIADAATAAQVACFEKVAASWRASGLYRGPTHFANSAGLAYRPGASSTMARPGLALYGYLGAPAGGQPAAAFDVCPALEWRARVLAVKDLPAGARVGYGGDFVAPRPMRIAVLGVGYADGFRRELSNKGAVWLAGGRRAVLGRVSMDLTTVDVTEAPDVRVGDEAELLGGAIDGRDVARLCGTIVYEILCGISPRAPRIYVHEPDAAGR